MTVALDRITQSLNAITNALGALTTQEAGIMATIEQTLAAVQAETTKVDSIIAYNEGLKQQILDLLAGHLTPEQQAAIDEIFSTANANAAKIDAAITAGTGG